MPSDTLELVLPDWANLDTEFRSPLPFALWTIGDQCLLHHWLDHAVNEGATLVRVHAADRPASVRKVLEESLLWPLKTELIAIPSVSAAPARSHDASWLPGSMPPPPPATGWDLLERAAEMEEAWLDRLAASPDFPLLGIGFSCRIHPEAKLIPPYFIGDHVFIGPGCEIGPYAVIGQGSVVSGANRISHSHLSAHSYLGPVTAMNDCRLENGVLFNLKHKVRLDHLEPHLVSSLRNNKPPVPLRDRIQAFLLSLRLSGAKRSSQSFKTFDGRTLPGSPEGGLSNRLAWLPLVWKGEMPLYGVLPRSSEQLDALDPDWQNVLRHAPIGVFSYADSQGCHHPSDPEEALHAVYQASLPPETLAGAIRSFIRNLKSGDMAHNNPPT
jgi:acetyltransferase-like isoleucine patch superfamily enzyme